MIAPEKTRSHVTSRIILGTGLLLTLGLFSGYRPWGASPINVIFLTGPVLLAAGAASHSARQPGGAGAQQGTRGSGASSARRVTGLGLLMVLIGGCPWLYTPYFFSGTSDTSSGMIGTIIFLMIGLPGLAVLAIGFINLVMQRRARGFKTSLPDIAERLRNDV